MATYALSETNVDIQELSTNYTKHEPRPAQHAETQEEYPPLVRKMSDDPGQKFYPHYWRLDGLTSNTPSISSRGGGAANDERGTDEAHQGSLARDRSSVNIRSPLLLHSSDRSSPLPMIGRSILGKREFQCPAGTAPCTSINRPKSCCRKGDVCLIVEDTGLGDVGCCPQGQDCSGQLISCPQGFTTCPADLGGGCCTPGYTCVAEGCLLVSTTTVIITLSSSTITSISTISQTTTAPTPSQPTSITSQTILPPDRPTSNPSTSATSTASIPDLCPIGFYACIAVYGGGCCQTGRDCQTTSCPITASLTTVESDGITVVIPAESVPNSASATPSRRCADGWMSCAPSDGGGCCPNGYDCGQVSCTASATGVGTAAVGKVQPENAANRETPMIYAWVTGVLFWMLLV
ncbi:hypothetical protein FQN49_000933 [Arthroderma sp. PD_2]|nr:hypothetical protein FQN49_000933 [Arthroderma sp. PD_2]